MAQGTVKEEDYAVYQAENTLPLALLTTRLFRVVHMIRCLLPSDRMY